MSVSYNNAKSHGFSAVTAQQIRELATRAKGGKRSQQPPRGRARRRAWARWVARHLGLTRVDGVVSNPELGPQTSVAGHPLYPMDERAAQQGALLGHRLRRRMGKRLR